MLRQMCTDVFLPAEGVLTQSLTRCCGSALSGPSGTLQGECRSPPAPDRYCNVAVTPGVYICHRRVMQCLLTAHQEVRYMHESSSGFLPEVAEDEDETEDDTADCDRNEESHVLDAAVNII